MEKIQYVGLDVHKDSIEFAVITGNGKEPDNTGNIDNEGEFTVKRFCLIQNLRQ